MQSKDSSLSFTTYYFLLRVPFLIFSRGFAYELGQSGWSFTRNFHRMKVVGQHPEAECILEL
jgi:hypothetical protein